MLGDPDLETSLEIIRTFIAHGAGGLELGLPFSDPSADGPTIQAADTRTLQAGVTIDNCFELLRIIRRETDIPIGLLVYYNLVFHRGIEQFYRDCKAAGVNTVLIADLPLEHSDEILPTAQKHGIDAVFLISELTTDERLKKIAQVARGHVYVVSYLGVTGKEDTILETTIAQTLTRARKYITLPLYVGFGINTAKHVAAAMSAGADGVFVGSRLVKEIPNIKKIATICDELSSVAINPSF